MYIVFVDDTKDDRDRVAACIPYGKFERFEPYSTAQELNKLLDDIADHGKEEPALILLDMAIGSDEQCGLKMLRCVRARIPHMPVVIVSQSRIKTLIIDSFRYGACSYIQKSVVPEAFEHKITSMLGYWLTTSEIPATANI